MRISSQDLESLETRVRASFFNYILGPKPCALVGTVNSDGLSNLAIFNSFFHLGANPGLVGCVIRPDSARRHTFENILATHYYSINFIDYVNDDFFKKAHQTSARYGDDISEFKACGLNEKYLDGYKCPLVEESSYQLIFKYREHHRMDINNTIILIGELCEILVPDEAVKNFKEDGQIDFDYIKNILVCGLDTYYKSPEKITRLNYAKPNVKI